MGVFLFEIPAILLFVLFADKKRMRELFPVTMSAVFLRFLNQFVVIDWLGYYNLPGGINQHLWIPISADLTIWPISCYFFIQYMPLKSRYRLPYGLFFVALMFSYLRALEMLHVFTLDEGWTFAHIFGTVSSDFLVLFLIWKWLSRPAAQKGGSAQ